MVREKPSSPKKASPKAAAGINVANHMDTLQFLAGRSPPKVFMPAEKDNKQQQPQPRNPFAALEFITGRPVQDIMAKPVPLKPTHDVQKHKARDGDGVHANLQPSGSSDPRIQAWLGDTPEKFDNPKKKTQHSDDPAHLFRDMDGDRRRIRPRREELEALRRERKNRRNETRPEPSPEQIEKVKDDYFSFSATSKTSHPDDAEIRSGEESPSSPSLRRRGAKHSRRSPRRKTSMEDIQPPPSDIWSPDGSVYPDDSASVVLPPSHKTETRMPRYQPSKAPAAKSGKALETSDTHDFASQTRLLEAPAKKPQELNQLALQPSRPELQRNITTDDDLMTVLSMPDGKQAPLKSACSVRSRKSLRKTLGDGPLVDIIADLKIDEAKYTRELRTLIDGVIPVLLTSVLSKDKANAVAGLFGVKGGPQKATTPIVNMGIALERLRSIHRRMPVSGVDALLRWADQAEKVYSDYIKAWRLGFQDVVVNLAPAEGASSLEEGLKRDEEGFVLGEQGERVDVAYLLKRPLVRAKNLYKFFKEVAQKTPSKETKGLAEKYSQLVERAKERQSEERARLEDEAAAAIDGTRARDPKTLAPLPGVQIDPSRCVRARDTFDLNFQHSSGQRIDCRVELIFRDDRPNHGSSGDVLICEIDGTKKWLLLPPIQLDRLSARIHANQRDLIVLIRGPDNGQSVWQEVFTLIAEDEQASPEWMGMLGSSPVPPAVASTDNRFLLEGPGDSSSKQEGHRSHVAAHRNTSEIDVPLGEQASMISRRERPSKTTTESAVSTPRSQPASKADRPASMPSLVSGHTTASAPRPLPQTPTKHSSNSHQALDQHIGAQSMPRSLNDAMRQAGGSEVSTPDRPRRSDYSAVNALRNLARSRADPRHGRDAQSSRRRPSPPLSTTSSGRPYSVWMPSSGPRWDEEDDPFIDDITPVKPPLHRRESSMPTYKSSLPDLTDKSQKRKEAQQQRRRDDRDEPHSAPISPYHPQERDDPRRTAVDNQSAATSPSSGPYSHTPAQGPVQIGDLQTPKLSPPSSSKSAGPRPLPIPSPAGSAVSKNRRSSSPLKYEYDPSTSVESLHANILNDTDASDNESLTSQSSADEDIVPSLPNFSTLHNRRSKQPNTVFEPKNSATLAPSNSASQTGYRGVPDPDAAGNKQIASVFAWSDRGQWSQVIPDECAIVVTPGLIEAFDITAYHSSLSNSPTKSKSPGNSDAHSSPLCSERPASLAPLLALELTPLVPLRRGTAIDISIRSPPTPASTLRQKIPSNQLMFRSRTNGECDHLYAAINHARIHNPTYIALQNARPDTQKKSNWASIMDSRDSEAGGRSWWKLGRRSGTRRTSSYRAGSSRRTPSVAAITETDSSMAESVGGALNNALKRLTAPGGKVFNVAKSTITGPGDHSSGGGWSSSSMDMSSTSGGAHASGSSTPPAGFGTGIDPSQGTPLGIRALKVRLYERITMGSTWRDRGSAQLTILQPPRPAGAPPPLAADGRLIQSKRVVVQGKTKGEVLLDATLGEEAFERVGRVGIAISVWEKLAGVEKRGSVMDSRVKTYMVQCRGEAEAAFMFGLVGRAVRF